MATKDLTIEVFKAIRGELKTTNKRLQQVEHTFSQRLQQVEHTFSDQLDRLERRQVNIETRLATELVSVVNAINEVRDYLKETFFCAALVCSLAWSGP